MAASAQLVARQAAPSAKALADEGTDLWSLGGGRPSA